ncbi:MAG: MerR family transcriptional regulator [Chitinophagaceae bacterium]|nr:MAG: MerR family transcriptional regulator [Chitinophagaceae bacterium]
MNSFTIKDLSNLSGIKAHTLRIWEQRYSFLKPNRTFTNIRYYSNEELKTILNIALLNKYGFKISHIDKMSSQQMSEKIMALNQAEAQQERFVNELIQKMVDLEIESFEELLSTYMAAKGIERTILQVIFPFLEKIGILWLTNHINPAQEHLVSNIIRQKLIAGIEHARPALQSNKKVLLFLPEGEHHELGLLFVYYILKVRGIGVTYLGANVPLKDVEYVANYKKPDYLYSHLTSVGQNFNFEKFLVNVKQKFKGIPLIVSGQLTHTFEKKIQAPIKFKRSFAEVMDFVATL